MRLKSIKIKPLFQCNKSDRIVNMELKIKRIQAFLRAAFLADLLNTLLGESTGETTNIKIQQIIYIGIRIYVEIIGIVAIVERYIENTVYDSI